MDSLLAHNLGWVIKAWVRASLGLRNSKLLRIKPDLDHVASTMQFLTPKGTLTCRGQP